MAPSIDQSPRFALRPLALLAALACASFTGAQAQATAEAQLVAAGPALKEVVISGSRSSRTPTTCR